MAIAAKRFQSLNGETDAAVMDMLSAGNGMFNSVKNELSDISASTQDLISQAVQSANLDSALDEAKGAKDSLEGFLSSATGGTNEGLREAKSLYGNIKDLANQGPKHIENQLKSLLPNIPGVQGAFSSLSNNCKNRAAGYGGFGKPYDASVNCGGGKKKAGSGACNVSGFNDILNKLTGGDYNAGYTDLNKTLAALMGLSKFGYNMNLCGVFGALSSNIGAGGAGLLSRASAGLLGSLALDKNTMGMMDLSKNNAGLFTKLELPGAAATYLSGISIPDGIKDVDLSSFSDSVLGGAELFDEGFAMSELDDMSSMCNFDEYSADLGEMLDASMMDSIPDIDNLDSVIDTDEISASFQAWKDESVFGMTDTAFI